MTSEQKQLIAQAYDAAKKGESNEQILKQLLNTMTATKSGKFNMWNYVADPKHEIREKLFGIYHENGYRIATDCHVMVVEKCDYNEDLEGKIMLKNGTFVNDTYPNYSAVIPKSSKDVISLDIAKVREQIKEHRIKEKAYKSLPKGTTVDLDKIPQNGGIYLYEADMYFNMHHFERFINAVEAKGLTVYYNREDKTRPIVARNEQGDVCVCMPIMPQSVRNFDMYCV